LSQILAVGSLFTQKAFVDEDDQSANNQYHDEDDDELTPEELRKEIFEAILKKRIFFSDRLEKVEKALISVELMSKEVIYCSDE
jgi:hypothetical protein